MTTTEHRFTLAPYKGRNSRHKCPECGHQHKFARYIDTETGGELSANVGRCDREDSCGYHYKPKQYFTDNPTSKDQLQKNPGETPGNDEKTTICSSVNHLPFDAMDKSVSNCRKCDLFPFLAKLFTDPIAERLCNDFFIGASRDGFTAFWQVDVAGKIRQCKVMQYLQNGHRNRDSGALFAGKRILGNQEANLQQCFFGEYLLSCNSDDKPVAIVESEKSAVICSVYYPGFIWLATGGKHGAQWTEAKVCRVLGGRKVILFPDLGAYDLWKGKGLLLAATAGAKVVVSDLLEKRASREDLIEGLDIADYLLRIQDSSRLALTDKLYPVIWDYR